MHIFHTLGTFFIPCASVSYLGIIGIFSYLRHHFIPFECSFIPSMSVFSYLLGCDFIPKLFNFIPLARFFHTLGITISYLLQSVSHPEQIYSYPNWTIHNPGWTFTIKLSYGSIGRHEWHTHPPANRNLVNGVRHTTLSDAMFGRNCQWFTLSFLDYEAIETMSTPKKWC